MTRLLDLVDDESSPTPTDATTGPRARKASRAKRAAGFITDRKTGEMGVVVWAGPARFRGDDRAVVRAGWKVHARDSAGFVVELVVDAGGWKVVGRRELLPPRRREEGEPDERPPGRDTSRRRGSD